MNKLVHNPLTDLYAIKMSDGSVTIMNHIIDERAGIIHPIELVMKKFKETLVDKEIVSYRKITKDAIPVSRTFRNAWTDDFDTDTVDVCPVKARAEIRNLRNRSLEALDKKAFAEQRKPAGALDSINTEAQRLRDLTKHPDFNKDDIVKLEQLAKDAEHRV